MIRKTKYMDKIAQLKSNYESACNAYILEFCKKHEFNTRDAEWVDYIGGIALICDYYISLTDMRIDIDRDVAPTEYWRYYNYSTECAFYDLVTPNYDHWLRGCPRYSDEQLEQLRDAKLKVKETEDAFQKLLDQIKG